MNNDRAYSPFKEVGIKEVDSKPTEQGYLKVKYNTKAHPADLFTGYIRPKGLKKFTDAGGKVEKGNYYSIISDGEYINYISNLAKPTY